MNNVQTLISLCIPTYNRPKALKELLDSILLEDIDKSLYEICIADDSNNCETENMISEYIEKYSNVIYKKNSYRLTYMNMINVLKMGNGKLLKLNNDYIKYRPGALKMMLDDIREYDETDTFIIYAKTYNDKSVLSFRNLSNLMDVVTYHVTWCSSFAMWKKDFDVCLQSNISIDTFFPHMDLLFRLQEKKRYIIYGKDYFSIQKIGFQGGYHFPREFGVHFLGMIYTLREEERINQETWEKIRKDTVRLIARSHARQVKNPQRYGCDYSEWYRYLLKYNNIISIFRYMYLFIFYLITERKIESDT